MKVLVATSDARRENLFSDAIRNASCELIHTASRAFDAFKLLQRNIYGVIISDDSLPEMGPLEFNLTVRDITDGRPITVVAVPMDSSWVKHHQRFAYADVIESQENVVALIPELVQAVRSNGHSRLSFERYRPLIGPIIASGR